MTFSARAVGPTLVLMLLSFALIHRDLGGVALAADVAVAEDAAAADVSGKYDCRGVGVNGNAYKGEVKISKKGHGFHFDWQIGGEQYNGIGFVHEGRISVSWVMVINGMLAHGVVDYKIQENGTLEGKWIDHNAAAVGTEILKPQVRDQATI
ncbi:MAG: hypothetical protein WDZ51_03615 [Pirellulaceae bacterium]